MPQNCPEKNHNQKIASVKTLTDAIKTHSPDADLDLVRLAYEFAEQAHKGQRRMNGDPYFSHPLAAAMKLAELKLDSVTIAAALLHDVPEETSRGLDEIKKEFGQEIYTLVAGVTKLGLVRYRGIERYLENVRRMFIAMAEDARVIFIKLADRLHNLSTLDALPPAKQKRIATESLELYAPIANRLGIGELKGEIEDLSFKYVEPEEYQKIEALMRQHCPHAETVLAEAGEVIKSELDRAGIRIIDCHGRKKRLYSLWKKLKRPDIENDISRVADLVALRIIVPDISSCYSALGIIHSVWKPLKGRIKDYIAQPKPNGYRSLHTTVFGPRGRIIEIQVRDPQMHEQAEFGVVAHWNYVESGKPRQGTTVSAQNLKWTEQLTKWKKPSQNNSRFLEDLKIDVFQNQIYVFTPQGDIVELPEYATPVDFAYRIHTDLGDRCTAAKINDRLVPLDTGLKNGDIVEIIVARGKKAPSSDWVNFVKTHSAREAIRRAQKKSRGRLGAA